MESATPAINEANRTSRKSFTLKQKMDLLTAYRGFDGSLAEFCQKNGLSRSTFRGWVNKEHHITAHSSQRVKRKIFNQQGKFPDLELHLSDWIEKTRERKRSIQYKHIREQTSVLIKTLQNTEDYSQFAISDGWISKFMERNNFSVRAVTHRSQENKKDQLTKANEIVDYLVQLNVLTNDFEPQYIIQMDETPTYIDSTTNRTVTQKGATSVEVTHTGNNKARFTSVLTVASDGTRLPTFVILKKLVKVPNVKITSNIVLNRSETAFMDNHLIIEFYYRTPRETRFS